MWLQSVWAFICWIFWKVLSTILLLLGLFVPPTYTVGLVVVLVVGVAIAYFLCNGNFGRSDLFTTVPICILVVSFAWNSVYELTHMGRVNFKRDRKIVVQRVSELTTSVNQARSGMAKAHTALTKVVSQAVGDAEDGSASSPALAPGESPVILSQTIDSLIQKGEVAIKLHEGLIEAIQAYNGLLPAARQACLDAADNQRRLAGEEPYAELKDTYIAASKYFERYAATIAKSEKTIAQPQESVVENARYVQHAVQFLRRFQADLQTIPEFPGPEMHAEVIKAIQKFVHDFERFRNALDTFGNAMPGELPPVNVPNKDTKQDAAA